MQLSITILQSEKIHWEHLVDRVDMVEQIVKGTLTYPEGVTDTDGILSRVHATIVYGLAVIDWWVISFPTG